MKIHKTIKKHAHKVFKHIKTYKHHYMFWLFGTFAIVKMILLAWGIFGVLVMRNTFAWGFDNGLVAYWSLNTNANDYINSNNGTTFNTTSITGKIHNAYDFNGVNAYIEIPNSSTLNITGSITIQAWIKRNSDPILWARRASIVNKGGDNQYRLQHSINNTGFEFAIRTMSWTSFVASTTAPQQDVWYFVVWTYDGSAVKIYVNGVLERSISRTSPIMSNISPVNIWRRATINDRYFDGIIDEVGIWNRSLTASEIASLYNEWAGRSAITQTYTLSYSWWNNGTLSGNSSQTVEEWTNGTMIEAIANSWYHFTQRNDGNITNPRTDSNVHSNISVTAQFTATLVNTYTLSYVSDSNWTIDWTASQTINEGENGTAVTAVANSGYHFTQRSDGSTTNPRTDTNVTGNISVTAQFVINSSTNYTDGLMVYLPFDSDMQDYSTNNNHGVWIGDISPIVWKVWWAYDFSDGEKYVSVADNEALRMIGTSYTLSAWTYMRNEQSEGGVIAKWMYPSSGPGYWFMIIGTNPASISGNPPGNRFNSSYSIPLEEWQLITVTFDAATNNHTIYVNGAMKNETTNGGSAPVDDNKDLWIGNRREWDSYNFEGYIDEVAIWNRTLTSNEIVGVYNNGNGLSLLDDSPTSYTINYAAWANGTLSGNNSQTVEEGTNGTTIEAIANSGYHFTQRSDGSTSNPRTDTNVTGNISVTAQFTGNIVTYTLMYSAWAHGTLSGTSNQTVNQYENGTEITAVPDFWYHFVEWSDSLVDNPRTDNNITGNIAVTAQFTGDIKSVAWWLSRLSQDNCPDGDYSASYYDGTCNNEYTDTHNSADSSWSIHHRYSQEFENVYQWAYRHKITTMNTIEKADIDGLIIRSDLAKMLVNYAVKILHRTSVDTWASCSFDDIYNQTREARTYIKLACQMWLMSGESTHFNPNTTITRAEFSTIFSRIVWWSEYNNWSSFTNHLQALKTFGIINNVDNPESTKELRGYIMLMMKRSGDIVNQ